MHTTTLVLTVVHINHNHPFNSSKNMQQYKFNPVWMPDNILIRSSYIWTSLKNNNYVTGFISFFMYRLCILTQSVGSKILRWQFWKVHYNKLRSLSIHRVFVKKQVGHWTETLPALETKLEPDCGDEFLNADPHLADPRREGSEQVWLLRLQLEAGSAPSVDTSRTRECGGRGGGGNPKGRVRNHASAGLVDLEK